MPRWQQEPDPPVLVAGFALGTLGNLVLLESQVSQPLRLRQGGFLVPAGATLWPLKTLAVSPHSLDLLRVGCW